MNKLLKMILYQCINNLLNHFYFKMDDNKNYNLVVQNKKAITPSGYA